MLRVVHVIISLDQGGAESVLFSLLDNLNRSQYKLSVIVLGKEGFYSNRFRALGIPVASLNITKFNVYLKIFRLYLEIRKNRPDIVHAWMYHSNLLVSLVCAFFKVPKVIWSTHNTGFNLKFNTKIINKILCFLSFYPKSIIFCSDAIRNSHRYGLLPQSITIENCCDYKRFKKLEIESIGFNFHVNSFVFGMMSRSHPDKDISVFLKASFIVAKKYPNVIFSLLGRNVTKDTKIDRFLRSHDMEKAFYRFESSEFPERYLNSLDCFVLTSRYEAFGNVVCEAMACECPVIVTDCGTPAKIVGDCGLVVPTGDYQALAESMIKIYSLSEKERSALGRKARERVKSLYPLEKMVKAYTELYI